MPDRPSAPCPRAPAWIRSASRSAIALASASVVVLTPGEVRFVVEVAQVPPFQDAAQLRGGQGDVDHDVVGVQLRSAKGRVDEEGRAVKPLRRTENLAPEAVRDHHVLADGHTEHRFRPSRR